MRQQQKKIAAAWQRRGRAMEVASRILFEPRCDLCGRGESGAGAYERAPCRMCVCGLLCSKSWCKFHVTNQFVNVSSFARVPPRYSLYFSCPALAYPLPSKDFCAAPVNASRPSAFVLACSSLSTLGLPEYISDLGLRCNSYSRSGTTHATRVADMVDEPRQRRIEKGPQHRPTRTAPPDT